MPMEYWLWLFLVVIVFSAGFYLGRRNKTEPDLNKDSVLFNSFSHLINKLNLDKQTISKISESDQNIILLIQIYKRLDLILKDDQKILKWFTEYNDHLKTNPINLLKTKEGLNIINSYVNLILNKTLY